MFNKHATLGLCTFLQEAAPPHLMDQLPHDDDVLNIYNEIDHFAFLFLKRLTTSSENEVIIFIIFLNNFYFFVKIVITFFLEELHVTSSYVELVI